MKRVERGDVNFNHENAPQQQKWRLTYEDCLKSFVQTIALKKNEFYDDYMKKYENLINEKLKSFLTSNVDY